MNHIWLRNRPVKLMWNHNTYLAIDIMLGISCAVWSDNLQETAMILSKYHFITHIFHCDAWRNIWSSAQVIRVAWQSKQNGTDVGEDGVIFVLLLNEKRLLLIYKGLQQVLMQYVSHTPETDEVSLVL